MPLRHRILSTPETVQDFELAVEERYWDGVELLAAGRRSAGVYLLGYVAEMILKTATFVIDGAGPADLVAPRLRPARLWAAQRLAAAADPRFHEGFHSLMFWVLVLREKRRFQGRPLDPQFDASTLQRVRRLYGIWVVDMRYQPDRIHEREATSVYDDVT